MSEELIIRKEITINASSDKVWDALTNSEMTKQYMFGCELSSDWQLGSELLWIAGGMTVVQGHITKIEPGKSLHYTTFDPNMGLEDKPENYLRVTYDLAEADGHTQLSVTQDFNGADDAETRYNDGAGGWDAVLNGIKELVES